jgi:hypothetical protein
MHKVFFDLYEDGELYPDDEGKEFRDLGEAKKEAESALHELTAADIKNERPLVPRMIKMVSENGTALATVEIEAKVEMHQTTEN